MPDPAGARTSELKRPIKVCTEETSWTRPRNSQGLLMGQELLRIVAKMEVTSSEPPGKLPQTHL